VARLRWFCPDVFLRKTSTDRLERQRSFLAQRPKDASGDSQDQTVLQRIIELFDADENNDRPAHATTNVLKADTSITRNFNLGFAICGLGFGGGVDASFTSSSSRTVSNVTDINGDGLPDLLLKRDGDAIRVQYNLGDRFSPPELWSDDNGGWSIAGEPKEIRWIEKYLTEEDPEEGWY
jgi:hypothetical protein